MRTKMILDQTTMSCANLRLNQTTDDLVDPDDDDLEPDDDLVLRLLRGTTRDDPKSPLVRYLTAEEEHESRKAFADLLRSGVWARPIASKI